MKIAKPDILAIPSPALFLSVTSIVYSSPVSTGGDKLLFVSKELPVLCSYPTKSQKSNLHYGILSL